MTAKTTRWFEYGDPDFSGRVPVTIRTVYQTGPNDSDRPDKVEFGTFPAEDIGLLNKEPFSNHVHSDGSLLLSGLSADAEDKFLSGFVPDDERQELVDLIDAGCSAAEAVDYLMTCQPPISQVEWAEHRDVSQQAVSYNVRRAARNSIEASRKESGSSRTTSR